MYIYCLLLLIIFIFAFAQKKLLGYVYAVVLCIALFAGLRSSGMWTDAEMYEDGFYAGSSFQHKFEIGYVIWEEIINFVCPNYNFYLFVSYLIILLLFYKYCNFVIDNKNLLFSFFVFTAIFLLPSSGFRQFIAMNFFLIAIVEALRGNFKRYYIIMIIGGFFHRTLWLCIPAILLLRLDLSVKKIVILFIIGILLNMTNIFSMTIEKVLMLSADYDSMSEYNYRMNVYSTKFSNETSLLSVGNFRKTLFMSFFLITYKNADIFKISADKLSQFSGLLNIYIAGILLSMVFTGIFGRFATYFFYVECLLFPLAIDMMDDTRQKQTIIIGTCAIYSATYISHLLTFYPELFIPYRNILFE